MFNFQNILIFSCLISLLLMVSCNGNSSNNTANTPSPAAKKATLPTPTTEFLTDIYNRVDYIDFVFDKTNFSVSVSDKPNAQRNVSYLSQDAVEDINCTPYIGRMYFSSEGVSFATAQIHYSNTCNYFIFTDSKHRPKSACLMSEAGMAFFNKIMATQVQPAK